MIRLRSVGALALLAASLLVACGKAKSKQNGGPQSDQEVLALKPAGTNAIIVHAIGYGTGVITISDSSQTCVTYEWGETSDHYSQVCWAYVPIATSSVTLTATPSSGSQFTGWGALCANSTEGSCAIPMDQDRMVAIGFWPEPPEPKTEYVLSVHVLGFVDGDISASPGVGLTCNAYNDSEDVVSVNYARMCTAIVPNTTPPTQVTLTATPTAGTQFAGWGGSCTGTGTCAVTMDRDTGVTAAFVRGDASGGGTPSTAAANCGDLAETGILQNWSYVFAPGNFTTTLSAPSSPTPYRGQNFVRAVTTAAFDFGLVYTAPSPLDARGYEQLRFAVRALNTNILVFGSPWQGTYPVVSLVDSSGRVQWYVPSVNIMPRDGTTWVPVSVPIGGGSGWTVNGTVDLASISRIEIHSDTWEWNQLTIDVDGLSFEHPATMCAANAAAAGLVWDGASWDTSNWQ